MIMAFNLDMNLTNMNGLKGTVNSAPPPATTPTVTIDGEKVTIDGQDVKIKE